MAYQFKHDKFGEAWWMPIGKAYAPLSVANCDSGMLQYRKLSSPLSASSLHHIDLLRPLWREMLNSTGHVWVHVWEMSGSAWCKQKYVERFFVSAFEGVSFPIHWQIDMDKLKSALKQMNYPLVI